MVDENRIQQVAAGLAVVPLGNSFALNSSLSGSIAITNLLGAKIINAIQSGIRISDIGRHLISSFELDGLDKGACDRTILNIVNRWQNAGIFAPAPAPFPSPAQENLDVVAKCIRFSAPEGRFDVQTDNEILSNELEQILACCNPKQSDAPAADVFRCVADIQGGVALSFNGTPIWSRTDRDEARYLLLKEAAEALCSPSKVGAVMHGAAALGPNNRAIMFIAESGSGKSTLTQGLVARGFGFLADDHIPLSVDGRSVLSFPTAAAVKPGAMRLPEIKQLVATHAEPWSARENVTYLSLPAGAPLGAKADIGTVVVPEYSEGGIFEIQPLSPEDAFSACIVSGARPCRRNPQIHSLVSLCNSVPFYKMRYSSFDQSIPACMDLVAK